MSPGKSLRDSDLRLKYRYTYMDSRAVTVLRWHIGDVVVKLRTERDWNATKLAHYARVSKNTITDIEKGRTRGSRRLVDVARVLETTIEEMQALIPPPTATTRAEARKSALKSAQEQPSETAPKDIDIQLREPAVVASGDGNTATVQADYAAAIRALTDATAELRNAATLFTTVNAQPVVDTGRKSTSARAARAGNRQRAGKNRRKSA